jgi:3-hydroxyisobutyrate dehydrogenase-like beta-hydroxyacid dehydrogenase
MGSAVGRALTERGHRVLYASAGRSAASRERAARAGLTDASTVAAVLQDSQVVLSICPPHAAVDLAAEVAGFQGIYVDANAVAPATAREIAALIQGGGGHLVDGGIVGPPPERAGTTRMYLSGEYAQEIARLFAGTVLETPLVGADVGLASALKMCYAAWTKGTSALLLAIRALAAYERVDEALLAEWRRSVPELPERSVSAAGSAHHKGWRWTGEMEEIASTFAAAGLPAGFHQAAAEIFARTPPPGTVEKDGSALDQEHAGALDHVVAALLRSPEPRD